jgi:hypothetical protein
MKEYNKIQALKYLVEIGPEWNDEWTEAGMYHILKYVIESEEEDFTQEYLDLKLKEASNF